MGRKPKFTQSELKYEAAQVLRHIKNEIRNNRMNIPDKTTCARLLCERPKIGSGTYRTLWDGERKEYLDKWYERVVKEAEQLLTDLQKNEPKDELSISIDKISASNEMKRLKNHIDLLNRVIREKDKRIKELSLENQQLRVKNLHMLGTID